MSTQQGNVQQRPQGPPPDDRPKQQLDVVYAASGGRVFEIPLEVAQQYAVSGDRAQDLSCVTVQGGQAQEEEAEVGGRHRIPVIDQGYYHSDWLYGPYLWITDGRHYRGWHWHPNRYRPGAYDVDD